MPQLNGIDAASQIVKRDPNIGIIMLSMHYDKTFLVRALAAAPGLSSKRLRRGRSSKRSVRSPTRSSSSARPSLKLC